MPKFLFFRLVLKQFLRIRKTLVDVYLSKVELYKINSYQIFFKGLTEANVSSDMAWADYFADSQLGYTFWIAVGGTCANFVAGFIDCCGCSGEYRHGSVKVHPKRYV